MGGARTARIAILGTLVVVAAATAGGLGAPKATAASGQAGVFQVDDRFEGATFTIRVYPNGSARWVFRYERPLANETEADQFRAFAERFRSTETPLYRDFRNQSRALVRAGADATGRNMTATRFAKTANVTTVLGNRIGFVEMSFTWTAFGVERPGEPGVVIGDVFEGRLYIGPNQALVIEPAGDLRFAAVDPPPTSQEDPESLRNSGSVTWEGERSFSDGRPRVEFLPAGAAGPTTGTDTTRPGETTTAGAGTAGGVPMWAVGLLGLLVVAGVLIVLRRRGVLPGEPLPSTADGTAGSEPAGAQVSDEELMDDDERVLSLLEANDGRMRQSAIVEETGWSKSKVSMVLSEMEDEDEISKLRVGRENIVSLPGEEPDAAGSPFDEES